MFITLIIVHQLIRPLELLENHNKKQFMTNLMDIIMEKKNNLIFLYKKLFLNLERQIKNQLRKETMEKKLKNMKKKRKSQYNKNKQFMLVN